MAISIDATVGGASANSYVTLAEADAFMTGRLNASAWETDATTDDRNRALVEATRHLSALDWSGYRTDATQALAWPRQWARDPDSPTQAYYSTTVIPERLKRATYQLALAYIKQGTNDVAAFDVTRDVKREKVDVIETEYENAVWPGEGLARYPDVIREIRPLLMASTRAVGQVVKG